MRVCWRCQHVNGDSDEACVACGSDISRQVILPAGTVLPRRVPDVVARRNLGYMLLLVLLPVAVALSLWFWAGLLPDIFHDAEAVRQQQLVRNRRVIEDALAACARDIGGVPLSRLSLLREYGVTPADLTPGADARRWHGPYLSAGEPFPLNPYRPRDGERGWRYSVRGDEGRVTPAHEGP